MCQFTQLEKVEPQEIFAEKECRILQALPAQQISQPRTKIKMKSFSILLTKTAGKLKGIFFFLFS